MGTFTIPGAPVFTPQTVKIGTFTRKAGSRTATERDPSLGMNNASFYGKPIPILWGTARLNGVTLWASKANVKYDVTQTFGRFATQKTAGGRLKKRNVLEGTTEREVYRIVSLAVGFGYTGREAGVATEVKVTRIWADGELIYDKTQTGSIASKVGLNIRTYPGSTTQQPDPEIVNDIGTGNVPAFRNLIYVVISGLDLTPYGGAVPLISAEITQNSEVTHVVYPMVTDAANDTDTDLTAGSRLYVNEKRQRAYLISASVAGSPDYGLLRVFDIGAMQEVVTAQLVDTLSTEPQLQIGGYLPTANWIGLCENLNNTSKLVFFHAETGQLITTYGSNSSALSSPQTGAPSLTSMIELPGGSYAPSAYPDIDRTSPYGWTGSNPNYGPFLDGLIVVLGQLGRITILTRDGNELFLRNYYQVNEGGVNEDRPSCLIPGPQNDIIDRDRNTPLGQELSYRDFIVARGSRIYYCAVTLAGKGGLQLLFNGQSQVGRVSEGAYQIWDAGTDVQICWIKLTYIPTNTAWYGTTLVFNVPYLCWLEFNSSSGVYTYRRYKIAAGGPAIQLLHGYDPGELYDGYSVTVPSASVATVATMRHYVQAPTVNMKDQFYVGWVSGDVWTYFDLISGTATSRDTGSDSFERSNGVSISAPITSPATGYFNNEDFSLTYVGPTTPADAPFIGKLYLDRANFPQLLIRTLLRELCLRAGYSASDIEVSNNITESVYGCLLNERVDLMDLLSNICALYSISMVESEGKIKFTRNLRGTSISYTATIPYADLAGVAGDDSTIYINSERGGSQDLPGKLEIKYIDKDLDYGVGIQYAKRVSYPIPSSNSSQSVVTLAVPLIMTAQDAATIANKVLFEAWSGKVFHAVRVSYEYLKLEPGDFIQLTREDGDNYVCRVESISLNGDRSISVGLNTISIDNDYTPPTIASPRPIQEFLVPAYTDLIIIDNILLSNSDTTWELTPQVNWSASYYSTGLQYIDLVLFSSAATLEDRIIASYDLPPGFGFLTSDLADTAIPFQIDYDASLTIRMIEASTSVAPTSATDHESFLAGERVILIGEVGRWEMIYYKTVVDNGDGTYTLSVLLRARNGSELWTGDHAKGDKVIIPNDQMTPIGLPSTGLNAEFELAAVGSGTDVTQYSPETYINSGDTLLPLAPWNVRASRSTTNSVFTWSRRSRLAHELVDSVSSVPLNEESELYEVDILDLTTGAVVRTVTGLTSATYTYSDANATTDGYTTPPTQVRLKVYQISGVVGRGRTRDLTVDVE
jgi:hypothetical protein